MIAALFVIDAGPYFALPDIDPWPQWRDARRYAGPYPVIAHPPCARWSKLAKLVQDRYGHQVGDDGGCFSSALNSVRKFGGVLEHPAYSKAWKEFGLDTPPDWGGWVPADDMGGFTCHVEQGHYGHQSRKPTWLYAVRTDLPELRWGRCHEYMRDLQSLDRKVRNETPLEFQQILLQIAKSVKG